MIILPGTESATKNDKKCVFPINRRQYRAVFVVVLQGCSQICVLQKQQASQRRKYIGKGLQRLHSGRSAKVLPQHRLRIKSYTLISQQYQSCVERIRQRIDPPDFTFTFCDESGQHLFLRFQPGNSLRFFRGRCRSAEISIKLQGCLVILGSRLIMPGGGKVEHLLASHQLYKFTQHGLCLRRYFPLPVQYLLQKFCAVR